MDVFKKYKEIELNTEFKKFKKNNPEYYLVHVVVDETENLEFGFYNEKTDRIVIIKPENLAIKEEEVFKQGKTITKLDLNKVKISYEDAMKIIKKTMHLDFSAEVIKKKIVLLQTINEQVWNITCICQSLNIINIRINAETGNIIRKDKTSLMNMTGISK